MLLFWRHVSWRTSVVNRELFFIYSAKILGYAPVGKLKLDRDFAAQGIKLVLFIEINENVALLDIQVKNV